MKRRFNKMLAAALAASLCVPALPAGTVQAANNSSGSITWTDEEVISVGTINENDRYSNFNEGWKFYLGDSLTAQNVDFIDASWDSVDLPHDFSIFQDFTSQGEAESGFLLGGTGWYRKHFTLPAGMQGKRIVLNFDGVYSHATVYVNGEKMGEHHYGYTSFAFDITDEVICDGMTENVIAVKAVNNVPSSRWYSGSGIYRDVSLIVTDPVHVAYNGTCVTTPNLEESNGTDGTVNAVIEVQNDGTSSVNVTVKNTIYKKGSDTELDSASESAEIPSNDMKSVATELSVDNPDLWSPDDPNLYYVRTEILQGNTVLDAYDTEFGFKWYEFVDNTGFQLNGENLKINGVCMHHDQGALGSAAYRDAIYRQLMMMKDMGVNTIRITHNPGAEVFVDICDEIGLLVIEEMFDGWKLPKNGNSNDFSTHFDVQLTDDNKILGGNSDMTWAQFVLQSTVKRDRNDASIILWSLGNEISEGIAGSLTADEWEAIADNLIEWVEAVDEAHPVTSGSNRRNFTDNVTPVNRKIYESGGVAGYNYGDLNTMNQMHVNYPVLLWSETASAVTSRGIYTTQQNSYNADGNYHLTSYDTSWAGSWGTPAHNSIWRTMTIDWIAGECVWTGFDYIGEPTPWNGTSTGDGGRGAVPNSSYFGIVDTAGFPKDNYYLYRSQWNQDENTLHLVTAWDPDNKMETDGKTPVWIYSNAAKVELYREVNGVPTLVGTATRKDLSSTTTAAGHVRYEYTTQSNDASLCTTTSGSNEASLYAVFNVTFAEGTIYAKAFDENGDDITNTCKGSASVSTPGTLAKLEVSQDKTEILADGSSLVYISVDVTDADGNLDTMADNEISFELTGNGEILGVDNGDQGSVDKFQQKSVLESTTSAHIKAYAGKALAIVRSTTKAGEFAVNVSAEGLDGESVRVTTTLPEGQSADRVESYSIARHCYVPLGYGDIVGSLPKSITANCIDGTKKNLPIAWETYDISELNKKGTFKINGSVTDSSITQDIAPSIVVHVYKPIAGVQGHSLCTAPNVLPTLPVVSMTYDVDGDAFEEFPVKWNMNGLTEDSFADVNDIVSIEGTVSVFGDDYPTKATVRVAEPIVDYFNTAISRTNLTDNGLENGSKTEESGLKRYEDSLLSLTDGNREDSGDSASRWTDYANANKSERSDNLQIAMDWSTAITTDRINLFFCSSSLNASAVIPDTITIEYATACEYNDETKMVEADNWIPIGYSEPTDIEFEQSKNYTIGKSYQLNALINPLAIRFTFGHPGNKFMGLNEIEVLSPNYTYTLNSEASLSSAYFEETETTLENGGEYTIDASSIDQIEFDNPHNASLTFIQESDSTVKVLSVSEDSSDSKEYTFHLTEAPTEASKNNLQSKLDEYQNINSSLYTANSYAALKKLIDEIAGDIDNLTESQLKEKLQELDKAYNDLVDAPGSSSSGNQEKPSVPGPGSTTGDITGGTTEDTLNTGDKTTSGNVEYQVLDAAKKTAVAAKLTKKTAAKITILDSVKINGVSCTVTQINAKVFKGAKKLKTLVIGKNVTTIGKKAFNGCTNLKKVTFKGTAIKTIGTAAFKKTKSAMTVKIPAALKKNKKKSTAFKKNLIRAGMSKKLKLK